MTMSNEERQEQQHYFRKIDRYGFRITFMQVITIAAVAFSWFTWHQATDEKQIIDNSSLYSKIDNMARDVRVVKTKDSLMSAQRHLLDSINLVSRFTDLKNSINSDMSTKFYSVDKRLERLEKRVNLKFVEEIKTGSQLTIKPLNK